MTNNTDNTESHEEHIDEKHFRVAIFGSARMEPDDHRYKRIEELARKIAAAGFDIVTGGGPGVMEAANKGHMEGRQKGDHVHSFGLNIKLPTEQSSNKHLDIKKDFQRFSARLDYFMSLSNIVVVAPGGIGTVLELFYTWQLIQVQHVCNIPIILWGRMWEDLIEWIEKWPLKKGFIDESDLNAIFVAKDCDETMAMIHKAHEAFKDGDENYCINIRKYKMEGLNPNSKN